MDLSQQELPLTSYFCKPRANLRRKNNLTEEDPSSVSRPSKRTRSDVRRSVPHGLPTPATSGRRRARGGRLEQLDSAAIPSSPLTSPQSPCPALPNASRSNPVEREATPGPRLLETGIPTPQTSSRQVSEPICQIDCTPLARPSRSLLPEPTVFALPSKRTEGEPSKGLPMFPVSSSQSQYLLPIDATPKRKQRPQRIEHVVSSQSQEERELALSSSLRPITFFGSSIERSPGRAGHAQIRRSSPRVRNSQHVRTVGYTPVGSPASTPLAPSRFLETKKADKSLESPRRKGSMTFHSPTRKTRTPQRIFHQDSVENIPPVHIDDSLTESESDPGTVQVPRRLPISLEDCPPTHQEDKLPIAEDDSATEAESDTEILRCVAEIGKRRLPKVSRKESPPAPVISPLVSPARPRIAPMPAQFPPHKGGSSTSTTSYRSTVEQPCIPSDSLPSVVRDFVRMFPGDESYPADFPESLRV